MELDYGHVAENRVIIKNVTFWHIECWPWPHDPRGYGVKHLKIKQATSSLFTSVLPGRRCTKCIKNTGKGYTHDLRIENYCNNAGMVFNKTPFLFFHIHVFFDWSISASEKVCNGTFIWQLNTVNFSPLNLLLLPLTGWDGHYTSLTTILLGLQKEIKMFFLYPSLAVGIYCVMWVVARIEGGAHEWGPEHWTVGCRHNKNTSLK